MKIILYIGLDVHKDSISIAVAESGRDRKVYSYRKISNSLHAVDKLILRLRKQHGRDVLLSFCCEAGPCGFVLVRRLLQLGHDCTVVVPSKMARKPGDKQIKAASPKSFPDSASRASPGSISRYKALSPANTG